MPISYKHKKIFIHIPKNAGTAITNCLDFKFEGHHGSDFYKSILRDRIDNFSKFCVIRDPIDRFNSNYYYARMEKSYHHSSIGESKHGKHPDFDICSNNTAEQIASTLGDDAGLLKHPGWKPQASWLEGFNLTDIEFVLYEELDRYIKKEFNMNLKKINTSDRKNNTLNEKSLEILNEIYLEDFNLINSIKK